VPEVTAALSEWKNLPSSSGSCAASASNLSKLWLKAFRVEGQNVEISREVDQFPSFRATRDDIMVEKITADKDLSEPVYWSETDSSAPSAAAAHRTRPRPRSDAAKVRSYAMQAMSAELDTIVAMLLLRLQNFNQGYIVGPSVQKGPERRRFLIGVKEVFRRLKQQRVTGIIIAPDIDEGQDSGLDNRVRELLAFAYQNSIPVIFALSRNTMGRALGKTMNVSILGVLDATGAQSLMKDAIRLAEELRRQLLESLGKTNRPAL